MILKNNLITRVSANCSEYLQRIVLQERREVTFLMNIMFFSRELATFESTLSRPINVISNWFH